MLQLIPPHAIVQELQHRHSNIDIFSFLVEASKYYPSFHEWYFNKVVPDIQNGNRKIVSEIRDGKIAGIAILKDTGEEKKICTLRISPDFQNRGIGVRLFKKSFEILQTNKPFLTVSEEKLPEFQKIFDYFNFELSSIADGMYRHGKKEYIFNNSSYMELS